MRTVIPLKESSFLTQNSSFLIQNSSRGCRSTIANRQRCFRESENEVPQSHMHRQKDNFVKKKIERAGIRRSHCAALSSSVSFIADAVDFSASDSRRATLSGDGAGPSCSSTVRYASPAITRSLSDVSLEIELWWDWGVYLRDSVSSCLVGRPDAS